jgi:hypothetical protein
MGTEVYFNLSFVAIGIIVNNTNEINECRMRLDDSYHLDLLPLPRGIHALITTTW